MSGWICAMSRDCLLFLEDIRKAARAVLEYTSGFSAEDFRGDPKTVDAVLRNLTIIGEAAKQIPRDVREQYPDLDWRRIGRFRDLAIHHYFAINVETVWQIVCDGVPSLLRHLGEPSPAPTSDDAQTGLPDRAG
jgi:uncharacterized protein with HEPN domain